jgi:ribosomal protein S18 acetylase RimI-like enzyme
MSSEDIDRACLRLLAADRDHVLQMMRWFPDRDSCRVWGGQTFRFPFTAETFLADSRFAQMPSYALLHSTELCGFGQYYLRTGRCHLARLAVAPARRGRGCGSWLIAQLMLTGARELGVAEWSLYVSTVNPAAIALYERLGFRRAPHTDSNAGVPTSHYMIKA